MVHMIGRADAAAAIGRFLDRVPTGPVGLVIEGEPGIGKTTVVLEVVRDAGERRFQVLQARPAAAEADFSYAGLSDLVRSRFDEVRDELPPPQREALEVALLLRDADLPADPRTTAGALLTAVALLGRRGPLVILIDDVQWLDLASRRAVQYLARRMPHGVGMVVASRSESAPMAIELEGALPPGDVERLVLRPLSLAALHQLISARLQLQLSATDARPHRGGLGRQSVLRTRARGRDRPRSNATGPW